VIYLVFNEGARRQPVTHHASGSFDGSHPPRAAARRAAASLRQSDCSR
jgi:hypothetical protein